VGGGGGGGGFSERARVRARVRILRPRVTTVATVRTRVVCRLVAARGVMRRASWTPREVAAADWRVSRKRRQ
jgi:hypothetical protein